jgi:hypothetical protein
MLILYSSRLFYDTIVSSVPKSRRPYASSGCRRYPNNCDILETVIIVLLLLAAGTASAQALGDGVLLIRAVSDSARSANGWRAEGTVEVKLLDHDRPAYVGRWPLSVSKRGPLEMRHSLGVDPGSYPLSSFELTVCDGETVWSRKMITGISARKEETSRDATAEACAPVALRWEDLLDSLQAAFLVGKDSASGCTLVKAEYSSPVGGLELYIPDLQLGLVTREMCVDEGRKVILWERFEVTQRYNVQYVVSFTYDKVERDPEFRVDEFEIPLSVPSSDQRSAEHFRKLLDAGPVKKTK